MDDPIQALSPDMLLRHESFVRGLVRGLLSDEARVEDVVQETWLRSLRRPPREAGSLRFWLGRVATNLARDEHRRRDRREQREQVAARSEAVEAVDESQAKLETQRTVVEVVLELREPYREVVLLHYFQGWSAARIAAHAGRSAATVRSQLSRAHAQLREQLDRRSGGGRRVWAALAGAPLSQKASLFGLTRSMQAALVLLIAGGGVAWLAFGTRLFSHEPGLASRGLLPNGASTGTNTAAIISLPTPERREPVISSEQTGSTSSGSAKDVEFDAMSPTELRALAVQIQRALEPHLLEPDPVLIEESRALLAMPDTGICRLLRNDRTAEGLVDLVPHRGGGAYYSFETREHSYNAQPQISFKGGQLYSGFYGGSIGLVLRIGDVGLEQLPTDASATPASLDEARQGSWNLLWSDLVDADGRVPAQLYQDASELRRGNLPREPGSTFLVRTISRGEHDQLVGVRLLALDELGCTIAWRILRRWPIPGQQRGTSSWAGDHPGVPQGPDWLFDLGLNELVRLIRDLREHAIRRLLSVPEEVRERHAELVGQDPESYGARSGFARILHRWKWGPLITLREAGGYFSFLTGSNSYDDQPDLSFEQGRFSSGFAGGDEGWLLDLGDIPFAELGGVLAGSMPKTLGERGREAWDFFGRVRATTRGRRREITYAEAERAEELGLSDRVRATLGHSYLLRTVLFDTHDHLVVFTVIGEDEAGLSLVYNVLQSWPVD